ncbi:MAG: FtsW/RodA/SpoVE family cell cycle protein [Eubacteriales bacterium]|nr:FtsW/RodA/SpoVE family cell cycle protein [Eubacteriales bacterium]
MLKQYRLRDYKFRLVAWVIALSVLGILIIGSADKDVQQKQIIGLIGGLVLMVIVSLIDYVWLLKFYWILYFVGIALLGAVIVRGTSANGATRWLVIAGIQIQPSDIMKIIMIMFFAQFFSKHENHLNTLRIILLSVLIVIVPLILIYRQPNLSTSILTMILFCILYYVAGLSYKIIGGMIAVSIPIIPIAVNLLLNPNQTIVHGYQLVRVLAWLYPDQYPDQAAQQLNSIVAIGSGQLYGKGLDTTAVESVKNGNFLAEAQTDFIFAVAGEELGFLGCCIIVMLELLIAIECFYIGQNAREMSGKLICCGMGALIGVQSIMNIFVATGLMPNTGLPLPFVSSGLTSLMTLFIGIGLVLNVGLQVKKY